jgi:G3E family GTPase
LVSERIPMMLLTGFHGAGKSTLLARWLAEPAFAGGERAILEVTDLAAPLPVIAELEADPDARYRLHGVVTAVDGIEGARSLAEQRASRVQAALADALW